MRVRISEGSSGRVSVEGKPAIATGLTLGTKGAYIFDVKCRKEMVNRNRDWHYITD